MADPAPPEDASPPEPVAMLAASRWAKLLGQLKRFRGPIAAIAGLGAILSGLLGYWSAYQTVEKVVAPRSAPAVVTPDAGPLSIVVLPFQNLTGDPSQEYVADGLTAALTADLSRIRDAFIVNAKTAFAYKDKSVTAQQVGKDLGVRFVLQGGVQRSGNKIRISAQLADASSNAQLWSESFEGDRQDLFALQDRVTTLVGNSIGREMVIVAARESETHKSSPKVADLTMRARALNLKPTSLKTLQQAEDLYRQALALDPNNASTMVDLAASLALEPDYGYAELDKSVKEAKYAEARALVMKAMGLIPDDPRIYVVIESYASAHGDYEGSLRAAETRLSLAPKNPSAYINVAAEFYVRAEPKKAIEFLTQAIALDPKHPADTIFFQMGRAYFMLGDNDAAIEWFLKSPRVAFNEFLAMAYALKGEDTKARAVVAEVLRQTPNMKPSSLSPVSPVPAFKEYFETKLVPAWRKAGLPE